MGRRSNREEKPETSIMESVIYGAKSSPCCTIYIKNKNATQYANIYVYISKNIIRDS
jgi:hypothetical protein